MLKEYEALIKKLEDGREDAEKAKAGNGAAHTRVRKVLQEVRNGCADLRKKVQEHRDKTK